MLRGRLAPSPTGALHLGNARTFLLAWLSIRAQNGQVVLRIEDLDGPRVKAESTASILADLQWLGLDWDEGPGRPGRYSPYIQTERLVHYQAALEQLQALGAIYPCVCSRTDIAQAASAPHPGEEGPRYPGTCSGRFASVDQARTQTGREPALRFRAPPGTITFTDELRGSLTIDVSRQVGDFVVRKGSGTPAYQLAVVVDDGAMAIDEVVRGDDLLASTPRQILLYRALRLPIPKFRHVPLVLGPDGLRLAKRHGDTRIETFRRQAVPPERIVGTLAAWSGLGKPHGECMPIDLVHDFDWRRLPEHPIVWQGDL